MKKRLLPFVLAGALTAAFAAPAAATSHDNCDFAFDGGRGGAAALASLISVAVADAVDAGVQVCNIDILNNSLNNLLRNANIEVLNDSLNNLLRNSDIIDDVTVNVLSGSIDVTLIDDSVIRIFPA